MNNTTKRYARTMKEAFGPYTDDVIHESDFTWTRIRVALAVTYLAAFVVLYVVL